MAISPPAPAAAALAVVLAALCLLVAPAAGFYLPGVAPNDFDKVRALQRLHFLPARLDLSPALCHGRDRRLAGSGAACPDLGSRGSVSPRSG
jgi:hypothetical protein